MSNRARPTRKNPDRLSSAARRGFIDSVIRRVYFESPLLSAVCPPLRAAPRSASRPRLSRTESNSCGPRRRAALPAVKLFPSTQEECHAHLFHHPPHAGRPVLRPGTLRQRREVVVRARHQGAEFVPKSPSAPGSRIILGEVIKNIRESELVLCDISSLNENVHFELGMRVATGKPVVIVRSPAPQG